MTVWFTSDTHFGHKRIVELADRPFRDVTHMNEILVYNWNTVVHPDDTVYHLGDVALGPIRESLEYIRRLNGRKVLVTGNHDRNFRLGRRSGGLEPEQWDAEYKEAGFDAVYDSLVLYNMGVLPTVLLSHFPYQGDSHDGDRYEEARAKDQGLPLIHGHTHSHGDPVSWTTQRTEKIPVIDPETGKQARDERKRPVWEERSAPTIQIHVGVDAWNYYPVSEHQVKELLDQHLTD